MLHLYNTMTRKKEPFIPMQSDQVGFYVCGVTVYDHCHLGHGRSMVCFDVMVRFLRAAGYKVKFVRNITDIDDKIIVRAQERQIPIQTLTDHYIEAMHADTRALNVLMPDIEPRATAYLDSIVRLIQRLLERGYAYVSENGDVCYQVDQFDQYGKLSHQDLEALVSGARIEVVKEKRSPLDFVLWKMAKPGEPSWPSPWGDGRPGWHIECSAMAMDELGEQFDLHGGGSDLQFPHHDNEIAQSEGATGKPFANYWLHVGMLQINDEKMAKSTGNFLTIQQALETHHPEAIRYFLLSSHYRSPLNYSEENIRNAHKALTRLYQSLRETEPQGDEVDEVWQARFNSAMNDDFNTPVALSILFDLSHELNKTKLPKLASTLKGLAQTLGVLQEEPQTFLQFGPGNVDKIEIERLICQRNEARSQRDWVKADELRGLLQARGIELEDGPDGTVWRREV